MYLVNMCNTDGKADINHLLSECLASAVSWTQFTYLFSGCVSVCGFVILMASHLQLTKAEWQLHEANTSPENLLCDSVRGFTAALRRKKDTFSIKTPAMSRLREVNKLLNIHVFMAQIQDYHQFSVHNNNNTNLP